MHTTLTDNGIQFTNRKQDRYAFKHIFNHVCQQFGIEHRLPRIKHPRANGQVERINSKIKEATIKRYHYDKHHQFEEHLYNFIQSHNFARRLKTLKGLAP